ncbi:MAG: leucyl aminopeptidase [Deltaproteobacteria bacterium]|nr:leucyl aminopeptidase [Deltaproteobacteria bacterium]
MIEVSSKKPSQFTGDLLVYFVRQSEKKHAPVCSDKLVQERINQVFELGDCLGKKDECLLIYPERVVDGVRAKRLLVVGLGKDDLSREVFRRAGGVVAQKGLSLMAAKLFLVVPAELDFPVVEMVECLCEGLILGSYQFKKYKKEDEEEKSAKMGRISLYIPEKSLAAARKAVKLGSAAGQAGVATRDMAHEPANVWTPQAFADYGKKIGGQGRLSCRIIEQDEMARLKMGGILGVNQGSALPPKLVILEYRTGKTVPTLLLVGKGLTFDSGGISLKPGEGMGDMKYDMCGGAAVMAAMEVIAEEKPHRLDVVALVPATENMPSSSALRPGDIITQYGGKTVEVMNTDAEGRLILADALAYGVEEFKPDAVIDVATLTGAVVVGLGHHRTGLLSNNDYLADKVLKAGERSGELMWRLPLADEYREQLKSKIADLKNIGGKHGGAITAAAFLQAFVGETPWVHLDIAGTAWDYTEKPYVPKGPSGIGARTLIELVRGWQ